MEKITCGGPSESAKEKNNLYSLKRRLLVNKYYNKKHNTEEELLKQLKKATKNLKLIENIDSNSEIELSIYKTTSKPAFLWQEKIVNEYKLFVTMLGVIDGFIDSINRQINFDSKFDHTKAVNAQLNELSRFLNYRKLILSNYKCITNTKGPQIIESVIYESPSYIRFNECYKDSIKDHYQLNLQIEFINAYNNGYIKEGRIKFDRVFNKYIELYEELKEYKEQSNNTVKEKTKNSKRVFS